VSFQAQVTSPLVMAQADLSLAVLEAPFHPPPRERRQQQPRQARPGRSVGDEGFHLAGVQDIAGNHPNVPWAGQAAVVLRIEPDGFHLLGHRPFFSVLHTPRFPALLPQPRIALPEFLHRPRRGAARHQSRHLAPSPTPPAIRPHNQAVNRVGGERGREASPDAYQRVAGLVVSLGSVPP
jgi:hypothetical protein